MNKEIEYKMLKLRMRADEEFRKGYRYRYGFRYGEAWYNAINWLYPDIAEQIINTEYDPYYNNDAVEKCLNKVKELLE